MASVPGGSAGVPALHIRRARLADVERIVALVESAYRGESSKAGWTTEADLLDGRRTGSDEVGLLVAGGDDGHAVMLVAQEATGSPATGAPATGAPARARTPERGADPPGGPAAILGCCAVERDADGVGHFGMFAVSPLRQGAGVGRQLVEAAERHAIEALGAAVMRLFVIEARVELIAWYRRLGYEPSGATAPFPYGDERFGMPRREDLRFVVLERHLASERPRRGD